MEKKYEEICRDLGFNPDIHFVKITTRGTISFTVGKPDEVRALLRACKEKGYKPSKKLIEAVK